MADNQAASEAILGLMRARHSVREFDGRAVPSELRAAIIEAGLRAPTAGNMMLYSILEIEDQALKDTLAETCDKQPFIAKSPWVLVFLADYGRWMGFFRHSGVPEMCEKRGTKMVGPGIADFMLATSDAMACAQSIVIAAESFGLGSCYIGDIMERFETHRELFGLPEHAFPVAMLCLGYPSARQAALPPRPRFDRRHVVFKDRYVVRTDADYVAMFGSLNATKDGLLPGTENFGQHMYVRKFSSAFMNEMRRSVLSGLSAWNNSGEGEVEGGVDF